MTAYRLRFLLLILGVAGLLAGLWWVSGPFLLGGDDGSTLAPAWLLPISAAVSALDIDSERIQYGMVLASFLGMLLLTQWMFLRPRKGWSVYLAETARPMRSAIIGAAFVAMMLTLAAAATLLELAGEWGDIAKKEWSIWATTLVVWLVWGILFHAYWKRDTRFEQLRKMAHYLLVGSVAELIVATGVYVFKTDEDDCWCGRGSYTGLVLGATVMIWAFGPGLIFLFLREAQYHRERSK